MCPKINFGPLIKKKNPRSSPALDDLVEKES